ncbi:hypothetical protein BLNAU_11481 [Blattamonas nauphoetae]|uniref:Uncharacterized protein n=1 Tax=Blattamonas nauphoetae TaxID=2049346 RepID=A0ABQ9XMI2_9EUKA|nr:hypothetical protein BLNAU_11481 [Blattamonas nauphoetae]
MFISLYILSILHAAFAEIANAGSTVLVAPDNSASSDTFGCGTTVMPCKTIAFGFTQIQTTSRANSRIEIGGSSTCREVSNTLVDKPVDFLGQSRNATIGGDEDVSELKSVLTLTSTSTFSSLTLLRTQRCSFAALTGQAHVVFTTCTFGFVSDGSQAKAIHPSLLMMEEGQLAITDSSLQSPSGSQSITLLNMTGGHTSISKLSTANSGSIVSENASLLIVSGGSLNITDQVFSNIKRVNSYPSVLDYKAKTIQLYMNNVSITNCLSEKSPHSINIESDNSFKEGQVIVKNTKFANQMKIGSYSMFVMGYHFADFITPSTFAGTIPSYDQLTTATTTDILGKDSYFNSNYYSAAQVLYPHKQGPMYVDHVIGLDNKYCGQKNTPCDSFNFVFPRLVNGSASIVLLTSSAVVNDHKTVHSLTTIKGGTGDVSPRLEFDFTARLTVKPGMTLDGSHFTVYVSGFSSRNGFVVQGQLLLTTVHFRLMDKTNVGAVNVAGGMVTLHNVTNTPSSESVYTELLNVSRGSVFVSNSVLGGSAETKMRTRGGTLVFVQSGILGIENTTFQHIAKEYDGDGGVVVSLGGTIGLKNVVFKDCTAPTRAHCVLVSRSSFSADTVQMLNVSFSDGTTKKLNESVVLFGANVRATVNAKSFAGTLKPMRDTPEADKMVLVGQESTGSTVFPLALYVTGSNEEAEDEGEFVLLPSNESE